MSDPGRSARTRRDVSARALPWIVLACTLAACGKKAAPMPPRPHGPPPAESVRARQVGVRAFVGFTVPEPRGPNPAQRLVAAELVRVTYPPGAAPAVDLDVFRRRGEVVGRLDQDPLSPSSRLWLEDRALAELAQGGVDWTLRYGVRLHDARGRTALLALAEDLVPLASPPPPGALSAEPTAGGVRLGWSSPADVGDHAYNVYRAPAGEPWPDRPLNVQPLTTTDYVDSGVETGRTYVYQVRVALDPNAPWREGAASETREVLAADRFAPAPPRGLVAVQEGLAVRLFWDPNSEVDVAGYHVWRRDAPGEPWRPFGPELVRDNTWLDHATSIGAVLAYRITAVDGTSPPNESQPSNEREVVILAEPGTGPGAVP